MNRHTDDPVERLAEEQHGVVHRRQASELGMTRSAMRHRCRTGRWEVFGRGVYRVVGSPRTDRQVAMASVLAAGEVAGLSHVSGCGLWALPGGRIAPAHVTIPGSVGRTATSSIGLHRTTFLPPHHLTTVDHIPVLTPTRLLFQLAASNRPGRMALLTDRAWSRRLVSGASLHAMCDELSEHGRAGMAVMREVLSTRPVGYVPPESNLEARFEQILRDHDLPAMRRQVNLGGREWLGRVDFVAVDLPLVVFVDGEHWHSSVLDRAADARQQAALEAAGFVVVRVLEFELWHDVPALVGKVRAGWREARRQARSHA